MPARSSKRSLRWGVSASILGLIVLVGLGAKNSDSIVAFACGNLSLHCGNKQQVLAAIQTNIAPILPAPSNQPAHTASAQTLPTPDLSVSPALGIGGPLVAPPGATPGVDGIVWNILKSSKIPDQLRSFLAQFPMSVHRAEAFARLAALELRVTDCDVLAAHPLDQHKAAEVSGVNIQFINPTLATQACAQAVENFPDEVRFQLQLGRGYERAKRYDDAHIWYAKAADLGYPQAMHNLGFQYATGQGAPRDYSEARKWFTMAAVLGNAAAMTNLGQLYANGLGVPRDYDEARQWYAKAADLGVALAMANLGRLYANGYGVPSDYEKASRWYRKAADLGSAQAMYNLGVLHQKGRGVTRNYGEARKWYAKAAATGNEDGKSAFVRLRR